ncbi:PPE family protein, SVP subgroup [Mycobacterium servetii]|uniref:PPE family C-terminal domain-containing protein n=1 Tax=Mycobacterium servetii TaxID=3237418 RepID=A0ABV4C4S6_9MYCO
MPPASGTLHRAGSGLPGMPAGRTFRPSIVVPRYGVRITVMSRPLTGG